MKSIFRIILNTNAFVIFIFATITTIFAPYFLSFLKLSGSEISAVEIDNLRKFGEIQFFILMVLVAPIFETFIFQRVILHVVIWLLKKIKYNRFCIPVVLSGIAFGLNHPYNLNYIIATILMGLVMAFTYRIFMARKGNPFLIVAGVHSINNLIVFWIDQLN